MLVLCRIDYFYFFAFIYTGHVLKMKLGFIEVFGFGIICLSSLICPCLMIDIGKSVSSIKANVYI